METLDTYNQELIGRIKSAGLQNLLIADELCNCSTTSDLLKMLRSKMTQCVLDIKVSRTELERVFSQELLRSWGFFPRGMAVTANKAYCI